MPESRDQKTSLRAPRRDAARNRALIIETAQRLFAEKGVSHTSMEDIAKAAQLGKGTIFRHFDDRATLIGDLIEDGERDFQERFLRSEPPLGPGAPALERLIAFGQHRLAMLETIGDVLRDAELSRGVLRLRTPARATYHLHVSFLLSEAGCPLDADLTADVLLEALTGQMYLFERQSRERSLEELQDQWETLIRRLCPPNDQA
jgi:AcrR family transcriptional regulator